MSGPGGTATVTLRAVRASSAATAEDATRALRSWLADEPGLRGRVSPRESPPPPGALGPVLDGLAIALGSGGVAGSLVTAVVAWLRSRRGDVTVRLERADGASLEFTATRVQGLAEPEVRELIATTVRALEPGGATAAPDPGREQT
ncbi:effector-associated constant component EACC1 [Streptomyces alkaliphilus]|uniref:effector-associated constant component EACC1 n=1 Tax=Streptomyces alkaliphilus TaxID=1472722 RepID=UPI0015FA731E|nr:hypothetical protein [Streptomyces alkaliphilus]